MTLWSASHPASPFFMLLRGSKNNEKPPCHLSSAPPLQPSPSVSPSALSSLPFPSFGPSPPPFSVSPTPSESHHTDSEAEISHRDLSKWHGGGETTVWHPDPTSYILSLFKCEYGACIHTEVQSLKVILHPYWKLQAELDEFQSRGLRYFLQCCCVTGEVRVPPWASYWLSRPWL